MADANVLKKARTIYKAKFSRLNNSITKNLNTLSRTLVESRFAELKSAWTELQGKHDDYLFATGVTEGEDEEEPKEEEWIAKCLETFEATETAVDAVLAEAAKNDTVEAEQKTKNSEERNETEKRNEFENKCKALEVEIRNSKGKFQEANTSANDLLSTQKDEEHVIHAVQSAITRLEACKVETERTQSEFAKMCIQRNKDVPETMYQSIMEAERTYNDTVGRAKVFCSKHHGKVTVASDDSKRGRGMRLEKIKFDTFTGDIRKYPSFKKEFQKHIKPNYTAEEEAFVLKSYLDAEIREDVLVVGDDAEEIWKRLDQKYGNEGKLVDSIMKDVKQIRKCDDDCPKGIIEMIVTIERAYRDLSYLSMEQEISNSTIVGHIEQKLPKSIEDDWLKVVTGENRLSIGRDKFPQLFKLLLSHKERLEYKFSELRYTENKEEETYIGDSRTTKKPSCWIHTEGYHPIWKCKVFEAKRIEEKMDLIHQNNACAKCLGKGHIRNNCPTNFTCRVQNCGEPHHTLLHEAHVRGIAFHGDRSSHTGTATLLLLQRILVRHNVQAKKESTLNCLWDSGSTLSFITFSMAKKLNLRGSKINLKVTKIGGVTEDTISHKYKLSLIDKSGKVFHIDVLGLERISSNIRDVNLDKVIPLFHDVSTKSLERPSSGEVDCLMGMDVAGFHPIRIKAVHHLILLKNQFGLAIGGSHPDIQENTIKLVQHAIANIAHTQFEDLENMGVECKPRCGSCLCGKCHPGNLNMTLQEEKEYEMIKKSLHYNAEKCKWKVEYPCQRDLSELPENKAPVLGCLYSQEKRLRKNKEHAELYQSQIEDMQARNACRLLSEEELASYAGPKFYIAHHEIIKPESKSTPCRIVFNTSQKFKGQCLNDCYVKGPSMLNDLFGLLLRFSEELIAIICDLAKMYHSIDITLRDQMTHIFFWRNLDETRKALMYVMTVLNFGDRPSGSIAVAALQMTAEMSESEFPEACKMIKENSYMDDILDSVESVEKAIELKDSVTKTLNKGGFKVKEWIMSGERNNGMMLLFEAGESTDNGERVLGMLWDPVSDSFKFRVKLNFSPKIRKVHSTPNLQPDEVPHCIPLTLTMRMILSQTNKIYDPRGVLSPFTVRAKILMRKLRTQEDKLDWDDPIPEKLHYRRNR